LNALHESGLIVKVHELRGLNLVCWCAPLPCHGDLLLRLAMSEPSSGSQNAFRLDYQLPPARR
jgi:hypothetical protein